MELEIAQILSRKGRCIRGPLLHAVISASPGKRPKAQWLLNLWGSCPSSEVQIEWVLCLKSLPCFVKEMVQSCSPGRKLSRLLWLLARLPLFAGGLLQPRRVGWISVRVRTMLCCGVLNSFQFPAILFLLTFEYFQKFFGPLSCRTTNNTSSVTASQWSDCLHSFLVHKKVFKVHSVVGTRMGYTSSTAAKTVS